MAEFEKRYGGPQPESGIVVRIDETTHEGRPALTFWASLAAERRSRHILHYSLQLFHANGGRDCYVVSAGGYRNTGPSLADLAACLAPLRSIVGPTLLVIPEATALPIADFRTLQDEALRQCEELRDRFVVMDVHGGDRPLSDPGTDIVAAATTFRTRGVGTQALAFGAAYAPYLVTDLDLHYLDGDVAIEQSGASPADPALTLEDLDAAAALHRQATAAIRELPVILPPSAAVAGLYARIDIERGVWKAPAGVPLSAVEGPTIALTGDQQGTLTVDPVTGKSVNAIRSFPGAGTLVWGARTLAGNDNEWRYVNVRRLCIFVEQSITRAITPFAFEPNVTATWTNVRAMVESFLVTLWRDGALPGTKPEQAFYVAAGLGRTMTQSDIDEGRLIVEIGIAAVRPAEFVILRITQTMASD